MRKNLALLATLSMLVIGLSPMADQPEAKANTTTVSDGNCSIEVNDTNGVTIVESGNECVAEFKTTGINYDITLPGTYDIKYLLVGGGGAGGAGSSKVPGSGGGGGQVVEGTETTGSLTIFVGAGGVGADGGSSSINHGTAVTAVGGRFPGDSTDSNLPNGGDSGEFTESGSGGEGGGGSSNPTTSSYNFIIAPGGGGHSGDGSNAGIGTVDPGNVSVGFGGQGLDTSATNIPSISITSGFAGGGSGGIVEKSGYSGNTRLSTAYDGGGQGQKTTAGSNGSDNTGGGGGGGGKNSTGGNGGSGFAAFSFTLPTLVDVGDNCTLVGSLSHVTVNEDGNDCIVEFKSTDVDYEFKVPSNITEAWVLAVGGGGGGGCLGGGGAGGYIEYGAGGVKADYYDLSQDSDAADRKVSISIGEGGIGAGFTSGPSSSPDNEIPSSKQIAGLSVEQQMRGGTTTIGDIRAEGGGGGGCLDDSMTEVGYSGASGGGSGANENGNSGSVVGGSSSYLADSDNKTFGNSGGDITISSINSYLAAGSGGGGAGAQGSGPSGNSGGAGGSGKSSSIRGTTSSFSGGGSGGAYPPYSDQQPSVSITGGSTGGGGASNSTGASNTGGGGGGGATGSKAPSSLFGKDGGSGIAIIRFTIPPTPVDISSDCTVTGSPSGVTADDSSGSCVVEFKTPGITYDATLPSTVTFDYLLVGGGGAGGAKGFSAGSGGGGGQVKQGNDNGASLEIRVGSGGIFGASADGGASSIEMQGSLVDSANGGQQGGSGESGKFNVGGQSGNEISGGGTSTFPSSGYYGVASGGGGDANKTNAQGWAFSQESNLGGKTPFRGGEGRTVDGAEFGGGGGGGAYNQTTYYGEGTFGGGDGGYGTTSATSGRANSGGGGGGGGGNTSAGGNGGSGFAAISFSIPFADIELSETSATATGFTFTVTNYDDLITDAGGTITWGFSNLTGGVTAAIDESSGEDQGLITVSGMSLDESETFTVTATPSSGGAATKEIAGDSLKTQTTALSFSPSTTMKYLDSQALSVTGGDGTGATSFAVTSGTCTITGNVITAGTDANDCEVTATKAADSVYASKTASATITVNKADREISFTSTVPTDPKPTGSLDGTTSYTPTISVTADLAATLTSTTSSVCDFGGSSSITYSQSTPANNQLDFKTTGTCIIEADSDATSTLYDSATAVTQRIEIGTGNQNISFDPIEDKTITSAPFTVSPTSSAGLTVTATVDNSTTSNCSITGNVVQILAVGECIITATQSGVTGQFAAATPITQSFDIAPVVPGPPILESIGFDSQTINISFTAPSFTGGSSITGFSMVATDGAGNSFANNDCGASATSCSISGLTNGTQYTTTLVAINSAGESTAATAPAIIPAAAADSVSELLLTNGDGELTASWTKPTSFGGGSFTSYDLDLSADGSSVATDSITDSDTTSRTFTGLTNGVEYELELVVISTANTTRLQSNTSTTTGIPATAPSKVRNITAEIESFDKAFISWVEPESNGGLPITSYELSVGTDSTTTDTFRELTGLAGGDTVITIKAINAVGESAETFTLSLPSPPAPPSPSPSPSPGPPSPSPGNNDDEEQGTQSEGNAGDGPRPENPEDNGFTPTPPTPPASPDGTPALPTPAAEVIGSDETPEITNEDSKLVTKGSNWEIRVGIGSANADNTDNDQANDNELTPELTFITPMRSIIALEAQGLKPNTLMQAWVFSDPQYLGEIEVDENGELIGELDLPATLLPGDHTIQLASINASGETVVINKPITIKGKLTVGTFKGYIAIYSKDLEGQRLSAKVAGKWLVQDPIDNFKDFSYGRVVRFTGAGYQIKIDLYLNREFFQTVTTVTR